MSKSLAKEVRTCQRALSYHQKMFDWRGREKDLTDLAHWQGRLNIALSQMRAANKCFACGHPVRGEASMEAWRVDGLGPDCRARLAAAT